MTPEELQEVTEELDRLYAQSLLNTCNDIKQDVMYLAKRATETEWNAIYRDLGRLNRKLGKLAAMYRVQEARS